MLEVRSLTLGLDHPKTRRAKTNLEHCLKRQKTWLQVQNRHQQHSGGSGSGRSAIQRTRSAKHFSGMKERGSHQGSAVRDRSVPQVSNVPNRPPLSACDGPPVLTWSDLRERFNSETSHRRMTESMGQ